MKRPVAVLVAAALIAVVVGEVFNLVPGASRCCVETPLGDVAVQAVRPTF